VPLTQIFSVATFFKMFSLVPKGRHQVKVCLGTTCHLRGGSRLVESLSNRLGVEVGYTTKDMQFSLETVGCLGSCAQAPFMMVDDKYFGRSSVDKVPKILKLYK
jgi:NADH-quinone oxidoreductase subunit E